VLASTTKDMVVDATVLLILLALAFGIARQLSRQFGAHLFPVFRNLIWYHVVLSFVYYLYAVFNPSDSWEYFSRIQRNYRGDSWFDFYGVSTEFITFLGYPLVKWIGIPYEGVMMVFAWLGLLGFFYFYIFFKESVRFRHTWLGMDLLTIIFFLPNLHFWSASFGKGSVIFLGLGLFFFGIRQPRDRWIAIALGALIVYHVRPHVLFIVLMAVVLGFTFSSRGVSWTGRIAVIVVALAAFVYIYEDVMALIGFEEEELINQSTDLTRRVRGLARANSGVDITQYSFPMKFFTFLFRPLFVDAPGFLGIIVSFENVFYLLMLFKLFQVGFVRFIGQSNYLVKTSLVAFLGVSAALAQISANLGLAMRQKSQVMILFLFVVLAFLDSEKQKQWQAYQRKKKIRLKPDSLKI
jgi:hypothetical protein